MYGSGMNNTLGAPIPIRITKLFMIPSKKTYVDQFQRSFDLSVTPDNLNTIYNALEAGGVGSNKKIDPAFIAKNMPNINDMAATPQGQIYIPHGWQQQRFRFIMEVVYEISSIQHSSYIQGFTEYVDSSLQGTMDPRMQFFINSITTVQRRFVPLPNGMGHSVVVTPVAMYDVVIDLAGKLGYKQNDDIMELIRPVDIVNPLSIAGIYGSDNLGGIRNMSSEISNNKALTNSRSNNDGITHFSKIINGLTDAKCLAGNSYNYTDVLNSAANVLEEQKINSNPFISMLHRITGELTPTSFNRAILDSINPIEPTVFEGGNSVIDSRFIPLDSESTEFMHFRNYETTTAQMIATTLSAFISECLLTEVNFILKNSNGIVECEVTSASTFVDGLDVISAVERLKVKLIHVLANKISKAGYVRFEVIVKSSLVGDTEIMMCIENSGMLIYRIPTFADGLYTPTISNGVSKKLAIDTYSTILDMTYNLGSNNVGQIDLHSLLYSNA